MNNTRTQRKGSQRGEHNSYGRSVSRSHGYERPHRYDYSDDRDIDFEDEEDYDYENDRDVQNNFREDDNDFDHPNYRRGYEEDDEDYYYDGGDFQNEYEDDEYAGYSGGRRGRRSYEIIDREDVREIGRRGGSASYGGSAYGSGDLSRDFRGYRPYGSSRRGRATNGYSSGSDIDTRDDRDDNYDYDQREYGSSRRRRERY
ncbi:MAG: hypothetical protein ACT4ON_16745 [Bacteroidota bacterium]